MPGTGVTSISTRYAAALPYSHKIATGAEIWAGEVKLASLNVEASSSVTVDRNNLSRRTCSVVLTDPYVGTPQALVPTTAASILTPYGNEIVLYRGITYTDGTTELIQVGVFGIQDVDIDDSANDLVITLTGGDRSVACQHAGFTDIYTIAPGTNVGTAIQALISSLQTGLTITYAFAPTTAVTPTTPVIYKPGDDPWAKACELASAVGCELFFSPAGVCTFLPVPNPLVQSVDWSYDEGPTNIATHMRRRLSRTLAPNYIIRDGSGSGVANGATTIAAGSNGASLPRATINVLDTSTFTNAGPGGIWVTTNAGVQSVGYTGLTPTSFTGCTGGTGAMATKGKVKEQLPRGVAQDSNPLSPTYVGGPYGRQVDYQSSTLYSNQTWAQAAANADLLLALGTIESLSIQAIPKPDHDPDDVVEVTRSRSGVASRTLYVIDSFTLGFGPAGLIDFAGRQISAFPTP